VASLVAGTAGGALAVVSLLVALLGSLLDGVDGAVATEGADSVAALGIEGADSVLDGAVVLVLDVTELWVVVLALAADGVATGAGALGVRFVERLELVLGAGLVAGAALGAGVTAAVASATATGLSVAGPTSAGAGASIEGAPPASATLAGCVAGSGTFTSLSLRLWSNSSAPPITDAVMMPNAKPK
jgi:hypothetical protein